MSFEFAITQIPITPLVAAGAQTGQASGTIVFSNSNNVSFGMSNSSVVTASVSGTGPTLSYYNNWRGDATAANTLFDFSVLSVYPLNIGGPFPGLLTANTVLLNFNFGTTTLGAAATSTIKFGIYTLGGSTLNLLNSVSTSLTFGSTTQSSASWMGLRWVSFHSSQWSAQPTFSQTNYWLAQIFLSAGSSNANMSQIGVDQFYNSSGGAGSSYQGTVGVNNGQLLSQLPYPFFGIWGPGGTNAFPGTLSMGTSVGGYINNQGFPCVPNVVLNANSNLSTY